MKKILFPLFIFCAFTATAQNFHKHNHDRKIDFPDIPGYKTLVCDFHQHTVFSDGSVWPNIRVTEALKDSVDAISLTEHLEYQPHEEDVPNPDRNRSYDIATESAKPYGLMVIKGAEITRKMPPGHNNAIFIEDANKLLIEDSLEVFKEAKRQGAFTFWNHPNWIAQYRNGIAKVTDFHKQLFSENLLHGIEVVNDLTYSDEALQIALDYNLTIMGTSDIHGVVDWQYGYDEGGHRPVTLVFSKERSPAAIKEGLFDRRTVVWYKNMLIGRDQWLLPLIESSLSVVRTEYQGLASVINVDIKNDSDCEYILANESVYGLHTDQEIVVLHPNATTRIEVKTLDQKKSFDLKFRVLNAVNAPKSHPQINIRVQVK